MPIVGKILHAGHCPGLARLRPTPARIIQELIQHDGTAALLLNQAELLAAHLTGGTATALELLERALELRLGARLQLHAIDPQELPLTWFGYVDRETGEARRVAIAI